MKWPTKMDRAEADAEGEERRMTGVRTPTLGRICPDRWPPQHLHNYNQKIFTFSSSLSYKTVHQSCCPFFLTFYWTCFMVWVKWLSELLGGVTEGLAGYFEGMMAGGILLDASESHTSICCSVFYSLAISHSSTSRYIAMDKESRSKTLITGSHFKYIRCFLFTTLGKTWRKHCKQS